MHDHEPTIDTLRELHDAGVGNSHNQRLALLVIASAEGEMPMGHVADRIGMSRGALTTIVDGLVQAKLVKRVHEHGGDRRSVHLVATPSARRAIERAEAKAGVDLESVA